MLKVVCTYKSPVSNVTKYNAIRVFKKLFYVHIFFPTASCSCHSLPPDTTYDYVDVSKGSNGQMSVSMKYNEAYSSVGRKIITDHNQAYGVVQL